MRGAQTARHLSEGSGRHAIDPAVTLTNRLNDTPDAYYNTDCGTKKSLQKSLDDATNPYVSAFGSARDRFASAAAYRASTFASVVKEPYADPAAIGPGTYRAKKRAIHVKHKQVPTPTYVSKAARFEEARSNVQAALVGHERRGVAGDVAYLVTPPSPPSKMKGPLISPTPRFKSGLFPGWSITLLGSCVGITTTAHASGLYLDRNRALRVVQAAPAPARRTRPLLRH
jgi:hypothetical protein